MLILPEFLLEKFRELNYFDAGAVGVEHVPLLKAIYYRRGVTNSIDSFLDAFIDFRGTAIVL